LAFLEKKKCNQSYYPISNKIDKTSKSGMFYLTSIFEQIIDFCNGLALSP